MFSLMCPELSAAACVHALCNEHAPKKAGGVLKFPPWIPATVKPRLTTSTKLGYARSRPRWVGKTPTSHRTPTRHRLT